MASGAPARALRFEVLQSTPFGRLGALYSPHHNQPLLTPACLVFGRKGYPSHLTAEAIAALPELRALHLGIQDLLEIAPMVRESSQDGRARLHRFTHTERLLLYLGMQDPVGGPLDGPLSPDALHLYSAGGRAALSAQQYVSAAADFDVDLLAALAMEIPYRSSAKQTKKVVDNSLLLLDACLRLAAPAVKQRMLGVVHCVEESRERQRSALETAKRDVAGFVLGSVGLGDRVPGRPALIASVLRELPASKPRLVAGPSSPVEVIELVQQGVDLFSSNYPALLTEQGYALVFPLDTAAAPDSSAGPSSDPHKLNLRERRFELDASPLRPGCPCFACCKHTRAYIHHLLNTHEMLANVLLSIHNTHHYLAFFQEIRRMLADGSLNAYKDLLLRGVG